MPKTRTTATMRFWVLCGNDYPAAIYSSQQKADEAKAHLDKPTTPAIHWHIHSFELNRNPYDEERPH